MRAETQECHPEKAYQQRDCECEPELRRQHLGITRRYGKQHSGQVRRDEKKHGYHHPGHVERAISGWRDNHGY
jgi:hypothetical protein